MRKSPMSLVACALITCAVLSVAPHAAADPDHLHCTAITIRTVAEIPDGFSIRALQEGRNYPVWCR